MAVVFAMAGLPVLTPAAYAGTGGDLSGWHYVDSADPGGPSRGYVDLSNTGDLAGLRCDDCGATVTMPFTGTLYGTTSNTVQLNSNGWLNLGDTWGTGGWLRFYGGDLVGGAAYTQTFGTAPNRQFVVDYNDFQHYGGSPAISVNITFIEGVPGAVVTYGAPGNGTGFSPGLGDENTGWNQPPTLGYAGPLTAGLTVLYTSATDPVLPATPANDRDTFDYTAISSSAGAPNGFIDITNTGRSVATGDSSAASVTLPFDFSYYGTSTRTLNVNTDGVIGFNTAANTWYSATSMPDSAHPMTAMVYGGDNVTTVYTQLVGTAPHRQYIVEWNGSPYGSADPVRFEAVLFETTNDILMQYDAVPGAFTSGLNKDGVTRLRYVASIAAGTSVLYSTAATPADDLYVPSATGTLPDSFGYRALSSAAPGGPAYSFIDASDGTDHMTGQDDNAEAVTTPFPISLYGNDFDTIYVSTNGYLGFGPTGSWSSTGPAAIPAVAYPYAVIPFRADLSGGHQYTKTLGVAPHRSFVVEWDSLPFGGGPQTVYEVVFREDSTDVLVNYQKIADIAAGHLSVVGLNRDGATRLLYRSTAAGIPDGSSVVFTTDQILSLATPPSQHADGQGAAMTNTVRNPTDVDGPTVREDVTLDGISGLTPANTHLEVLSGAAWTPLSLTDNGGGTLTTAVSSGSAFPAGADLSVPLRLRVDEGAPTGVLTVSLALHSLDDLGAVNGTIARSASSVVVDVGVPAAPASVSAEAGDGQATVSWTPPSSDGGSAVTGYTVTVSPGGASSSFAADALQGVVSGLLNGTAYSFTVVATNAVGDSVSSAASPQVTPYGVPFAPGTPSGTPGNGTVHVTWTAAAPNGSAVTGYTVTASPGGASASVGGSSLSADVGGLTNGTAYMFTVVATNAAGPSSPSPASDAVTPAPVVPSAVTDVVATAGDTSATVSWSAPSSDGGSALTGYTVTASPGGASASVDGSSLSTSVGGLTNGTAYTFTVVATNAVGDSPVSDASAAVTPDVVPLAPGSVTLVPRYQSVDVNWLAPVGNGGTAVTGYDVELTKAGGSPVVTQVSADSTATTVSSLADGAVYTARVRAVNAFGAGAWSEVSEGAAPRPDPVSALTAVGGLSSSGANTLSASWTYGAGAVGAKVCVVAGLDDAAPSCAGTLVTAPVSSLSVTSGLAAGTAYTVTVFARDADGVLAPVSSVTLAASSLLAGKSQSLGYGRATAVSAMLGVAGASGQLWSRPGTSGTWKLAGTYMSSGSGVLTSGSLKPLVTTSYQWRYVGSSVRMGAVSAPIVVTVVPVLSSTLTPGVVRKGAVAYLWGTFTPGHAGAVVFLQKLAGRTWVTTSTRATLVRQKMPNGKTVEGYKFAIRPSAKGKVTWRAYFKGDTKYGAAASTARVLTAV